MTSSRPEVDEAADRWNRPERDLLESWRLLAALVDSSPDLIWTVDARDFRLLTFNRALQQYYAAHPRLSLYSGMTQEELLPEPARSGWVALYRRTLDEGSVALEYDTIHGDRTLDLRLHLVRDRGEPFAVSVFGRDITQQKHAEAELRASERKYRELVERVPLGVYRRYLDPGGGYLYVNGAHLRQFECETFEEFRARYDRVGERWARPEEYAAFVARIRQERSVEGFEVEVSLRDGRSKWFALYAHCDDDDRTISGFAVDVTAQKHGEAERARLLEQQVALSARLQRVAEEEKARMSRDLHDRLGQLLTGLKLEVDWLEDRLEALAPTREVNELVERAVAASELAERTIVEVQRIATDLRPPALDRLGLGAALQQEARRFQERTGITCRAVVAAPVAPLSPEGETALYRIAQEALTNVVRHARARQVVLTLAAEPPGVLLAVEDDGVGCDPAAALEPGSLGLAGMRERAVLEGGELVVRRRPGGGTLVEARLPRRRDGPGAPRP